MRYLYNFLIHLAAPLVFATQILRGFSDRAHWERLGERFGFTRLRFAQPPWWVHAVSVGEVQAAAPLIRALLAHPERRPIVVTTGTTTGAARVRALFGKQVHHCYFPYDLPGAIRRFLSRVQPRLAVVLETELWPNLLSACEQRGVPVLLASARISPRTASRYRRLRGLFRGTLEGVFVAAQTEADAERFRALGATPAHVSIAGNLKFDIDISAEITAAGQAWRAMHAAQRPVWTAGSTHPGEEEQVLAAHRQVLQEIPEALLTMAPRHPQRFAQAAALLREQMPAFVTRSSLEPVTAQTQVLLVDTLGELTQFYAAGDAVFVGGSLVPIGGHNLLEPAALAKAAISGPSVFNAQDIAEKFFAADAALKVHSADELARTVIALLRSPERRDAIGQRALALVNANRGALARVMRLIEVIESTSR